MQKIRTLPILAALAALGLLSCQSWFGEKSGSCADTARLDLPVNLQTFADKGVIWPHGVHTAGDPAGHSGIDFVLVRTGSEMDIPVFASISGEVLSVTAEAAAPGNSCLVIDSACVEVNFCDVRLDSAIVKGAQVRRGQKIGTVGLSADAGQYSLHFGAYMGNDADQICAADLLDRDSVLCELGLAIGDSAPSTCGERAGKTTLMGRSAFAESQTREITVTCEDSTTQTFSMPAEPQLCNPRLSGELQKQMKACLGNLCAGIW